MNTFKRTIAVVALLSGFLWACGESSTTEPAPDDDSKAVSYTHLDVYKRQVTNYLKIKLKA